MKLTDKTQTELDIEKIEKSAENFGRSIESAIFNLNESYRMLWDLPDTELENVLNALSQNGRLQNLFEDHYFAATSLNLIAEKIGGISSIASHSLGRELVTDNGYISVVPFVLNNETSENIVEN